MAGLRKVKLKNRSVYHVYFTFQGKQHVWSTKTDDPKIAKEILGDIQGKIARKTFNLDEVKRKDAALSDFQEEYFKYARSYKAKTTLELEGTYIPMFVQGMGPNRSLRSIDAAEADKWMAQFGANVSPATANIVLRILRAMFNLAKRWEYVDTNPFDNVQKFKVPERRFFLLDDEMRALFKLIDRDVNEPKQRDNVHLFRKRFRLYVEFLLLTGLRRNEALTLRQEDIDWSHNVIYVQRTKTKKMRSVPLNRRSQEILREMGTELFAGLNEHVVTEKFREYLREAGLKGFKLHSLRHTFGCRLYASGVDIYTLSRLMGHTDIKTTMIYAKANLVLLKSAVDKLDGDKMKYLEGAEPPAN